MNCEATTLMFLKDQLLTAKRPIVLCSFGKDSTVLLHLCLRIRKVPVLFFRLPGFQEKYDHAYKVARLWDLKIFDMRPLTSTEYQHDDFFEVIHFYPVGDQANIVLLTGIRPRRSEETRFLCAWEDLVLRPCAAQQEYPWDLTVHGHKQCDDPELATRTKFTMSEMMLGNTHLLLPLRDWSHEDVWHYIHKYNIPYDQQRYDDQVEDTSPDRYPTCFACLDVRHRGEMVPCPKYGSIESQAMEPVRHEILRKTILEGMTYAQSEGEARRTPIQIL